MPDETLSLLLLAAAYLAGHLAVTRLERAGVTLRGAEYVVVGLLAGPLVLDMPVTDLIEHLSPVLAVAVTLLGLEVGLRFRLRSVAELRPAAFQGALILIAVTLLLTVGGSFVGIRYLLGVEDPTVSGPAAVALGAAALPSSSRALAGLVRSLRATGWMSETLVAVSWLAEVTAIALFGLLFCVFREGEVRLVRPLTAVEWAFASAALGLLLGAVFAAMLGNERRPERLLVELLGIGVLLGGLAWHLNLAPLQLGLLAGISMANLSPVRERLLDLSAMVVQPLLPALGLFAGALWVLPPGAAWAIAAIAICARLVARLLAGRLLGAASTHPAASTRGIGRGFMSQGAVALAMGVGFQQAWPGPVGVTVLTTLTLSALLFEIPAGRLARDLLVDAGDVPLEGESGPQQTTEGSAT